MHMLAVKCMQVDMSLAFEPPKCILTKYSILTAVVPRSVLSAPFHPLITSQMSAACICVGSWSYLSLVQYSTHHILTHPIGLYCHLKGFWHLFVFFKALYGKTKLLAFKVSRFSKCSENSIYFQPESAEIISAVQCESRSGNHSISQYQKQTEKKNWRLPLVILVNFLSTTVNQSYLSMPISWQLPFWDYDCRINFKSTYDQPNFNISPEERFIDLI